MDRPPRGAGQENYRRDFAFILFRRRSIILNTMLTVFVLAVAVAVFWPSSWQAYGRLLVKSRMVDKDPTALEATELRSPPVSDEDLYSELAIITSEGHYLNLLAHMEKAGHRELLAALGETPAQQLKKLRGAIEARVVPTTKVIEVSVTAGEGEMAYQILDTLFQTYGPFRDSVYRPGTVGTFLAQQASRTRGELEQAYRDLADLTRRTGVSAAGSPMAGLQSMRTQFDAALAGEQETIDRLRSEVAAVTEMLQTPDMGAAEDRAQLVAFAVKQRNDLEAAQAEAQRLADSIDTLDQRIAAVRAAELELLTLTREIDVLQRSFETLLTRQAESRMDLAAGGGLQGSYVSVVVPPTLLPTPVFPKKSLILPAGLIGGLLLGLSLALIEEFLSHTFARPQDVMRVLGVPTAFSIPGDPPPPGMLGEAWAFLAAAFAQAQARSLTRAKRP